MEASPWIPDLDGPVFAAGNEPLAFVVKRDGGDVGSVTLERNQLRRTNMRGGKNYGNPKSDCGLTGVEEEFPTS